MRTPAVGKVGETLDTEWQKAENSSVYHPVLEVLGYYDPHRDASWQASRRRPTVMWPSVGRLRRKEGTVRVCGGGGGVVFCNEGRVFLYSLGRCLRMKGASSVAAPGQESSGCVPSHHRYHPTTMFHQACHLHFCFFPFFFWNCWRR